MRVYEIGEQISGVDEFGNDVEGVVVNYGTDKNHAITGYEVAHQHGQSHVYADLVHEPVKGQATLF